MRNAQLMQIMVHGGAGQIAAHRHAVCLAGCRSAAALGWRLLQRGGSALDAVTAAVQALEDDPEFNAGVGAALRADGRVQLDASIMDGATRRAGAVAVVEGLRNPVLLARRLLEDGGPVMLSGRHAERHAEALGMPRCPADALVVPRQRRHLGERHGTVGAVARDRLGRLAAATSTGGYTGAPVGRIGDSPLIGCGTYADRGAAVSCTGSGEAIIRSVLAHRAALLASGETTAQQASEAALLAFAEGGDGDAGLIMIDAAGRFGRAHNTPHLPVAWVDAGASEGAAL